MTAPGEDIKVDSPYAPAAIGTLAEIKGSLIFPCYTWDLRVAILVREELSMEYLVGEGMPARDLVRENSPDGILWLISVYGSL